MKLLFVDCCVSQRGKDSRTLALAERYVAAFRAKHPEAEVERVDAGALKLAPFTAETLTERDALAQTSPATLRSKQALVLSGAAVLTILLL